MVTTHSLFPSLPGQSGLIRAKLDHPLMFDFRDINGPPIGASKTEVGWACAEHINLGQDLSVRLHFYHGSLAVPSDVEVALLVAAHAIEAVVRKLPDQSFLRQSSVLLDRECPDVALQTLIDVQRAVVRADFDAIGRAEFGRQTRDVAAAVDPPQLSAAVTPVGIAGIQHTVTIDGQVVGLIHAVIMSKDLDRTSSRVNTQDIVLGIICHVDHAASIKPDPVTDTPLGQRDEQFCRAVTKQASDRPLLLVVDSVEHAIPGTGRALDAGGEEFLVGAGHGNKQLLGRLLLCSSQLAVADWRPRAEQQDKEWQAEEA